MDKYFKEKRILVTGGCQGIGRGIALELWRQGAHIVVLSNQHENLEKLKKEYPSIEIACVDLLDWDKTRETVDSLGTVHGLVNSAGICILESFFECSPQSFDILMDVKTSMTTENFMELTRWAKEKRICFRLMDVKTSMTTENFMELTRWAKEKRICFRTMALNVKAILNVSQIVAKKMIENNIKGSIVNISSQASIAALKDHTAYCASKSAVDSLTRTMALELGPHGIRANTVNPTVIMTDMGRKVWADPAKSQGMLSKIPMGRFGEVQEVVDTVIFLLSDSASMITGVQLPVDGGFLAT